MVSRRIKSVANALLRRFGYTLQRRRVEPVDLLGEQPDPSSVLYRTEIRPVLMTLPLARARSTDLYPIAQHVFHVAAACAMERDGVSGARIEEVIGAYRDACAYGNGAERMGISEAEAPALARCPGWFRLRPWDESSVKQRLSELQASAMRAGLREGVSFSAPDEGFLVSGSAEMIRLQAKRLHELLQSMREQGFVRSRAAEGDIKAELLLDPNGQWCWHIRQGNHRAAAALALGMDSLPVRIVRLIYGQDAASWPNVRSGVFTTGGALRIFDNLVAGRVPAKAGDWLRLQHSLLESAGVLRAHAPREQSRS